jgi:hypothetical protein
MMPADPKRSCEDVLYAFAVEPNPGRHILEQYLRDYPEYAIELIDLSYELSREVDEDEAPLSADDHAVIDSAWRRYVEASPREATNPFANLSVAEQRDLAQRLDVPRQVITAFREHRVELASVPSPFLERLAAALSSTVEILRNALPLPPEPGLMRSYKSGAKPETQTSVTFERLLIDADVPLDKRVLLMTDES